MYYTFEKAVVSARLDESRQVSSALDWSSCPARTGLVVVPRAHSRGPRPNFCIVQSYRFDPQHAAHRFPPFCIVQSYHFVVLPVVTHTPPDLI